jgi:hypothetical protein
MQKMPCIAVFFSIAAPWHVPSFAVILPANRFFSCSILCMPGCPRYTGMEIFLGRLPAIECVEHWIFSVSEFVSVDDRSACGGIFHIGSLADVGRR